MAAKIAIRKLRENNELQEKLLNSTQQESSETDEKLHETSFTELPAEQTEEA